MPRFCIVPLTAYLFKALLIFYNALPNISYFLNVDVEIFLKKYEPCCNLFFYIKFCIMFLKFFIILNSCFKLLTALNIWLLLYLVAMLSRDSFSFYLLLFPLLTVFNISKASFSFLFPILKKTKSFVYALEFLRSLVMN